MSRRGVSSDATFCPSTPRFTTAPMPANARSSTGPAPWGLWLAILAYATCFDRYDSGGRARLHQAVHEILIGQISRIIFVGFKERGTERCFIRGRCSRSNAICADSRSILGHSIFIGSVIFVIESRLAYWPSFSLPSCEPSGTHQHPVFACELRLKFALTCYAELIMQPPHSSFQDESNAATNQKQAP